jgi:hypothetical protein
MTIPPILDKYCNFTQVEKTPAGLSMPAQIGGPRTATAAGAYQHFPIDLRVLGLP